MHQNKWHISVHPGPKRKNGFFWDKRSGGKSPVYFVIGAGSLEAGVFAVEIDHSLKAFGKKKKKKVALTRAEEQSPGCAVNIVGGGRGLFC